jgi:hypothetical protein
MNTRWLVLLLMAVLLDVDAAGIDVTTATYLSGGTGRQEWTAVDIAPDGSIVIAGGDGTIASLQMDEKVFGRAPKKGHLYVWDKDGKRLCDVLLQKYKYPKDLCISGTDGLVIIGGFNTYAADSKHMKNHPKPSCRDTHIRQVKIQDMRYPGCPEPRKVFVQGIGALRNGVRYPEE